MLRKSNALLDLITEPAKGTRHGEMMVKTRTKNKSDSVEVNTVIIKYNYLLSTKFHSTQQRSKTTRKALARDPKLSMYGKTTTFIEVKPKSRKPMYNRRTDCFAKKPATLKNVAKTCVPLVPIASTTTAQVCAKSSAEIRNLDNVSTVMERITASVNELNQVRVYFVNDLIY